MYKIQRTIDIKAPVHDVYAFITQPTNLVTVWPNLVSVSNVVARTDGAHDFDFVFKMAGIQIKGHTKIEEAQHDKYLHTKSEGGITSYFRWTFSGRDGSGSRVGLDLTYTVPTPIIGKVAEALVAKINERDLDLMLANLKDVLEHGATAAATTGARAHAR